MNDAAIALAHLKKMSLGGGIVLDSAEMEERYNRNRDFKKFVDEITNERGISRADLFRGFCQDNKEPNHLKSLLDYVLKEAGPTCYHRPVIDYVETETPNGFAIYVPTDKSYAIGIDPAFKTIFWYVIGSSIVALGAHPEEKDNATLKITTALFVNMLINYMPPHIKLEGLYELQGDLDHSIKPYLSSVNLLTDSMMLFLVAHEVGHIALGHFGRTNESRLSSITIDKTDGEISTFKHELEYEADEWAAHILTSHPDTKVAIFAPVLFFSIVSIIGHIMHPRTKIGQRVSRSHPDPIARANRLIRNNGINTDQFPSFSALSELLMQIPETPAFKKTLSSYGEVFQL